MAFQLEEALEQLLQLQVNELEGDYREREQKLDARLRLPFAIRLDGVGFSKVLSGFQEPRDRRVHEALIAGTSQVVNRLSASCAYTVSDEVNILFLGPSLPYAGRVQKVVSISASILSVNASEVIGRRLFFDARVVPLIDIDDAKRYILYRARIAFNNFVGRSLKLLNVKPRENTNLRQQVRLLEENGVRVIDHPLWEWGGTSLYWVAKRGIRSLDWNDGPWVLLEAIEAYRAPELYK
ncbi:MAG: tRNA(His) guanylyltransferase Thg1 family protein [Thermofilaceae archaeon]